jgi:hypothetical protein
VLSEEQTRRDEGTGQGSEIKKGTFLFQELSQITVDKVEHLIQLIDGSFRVFNPCASTDIGW